MALPPLHEYDGSRFPADPWFQAFADPSRTYSNLPMLVQFFEASRQAAPAPEMADFVQYAWMVATAGAVRHE